MLFFETFCFKKILFCDFLTLSFHTWIMSKLHVKNNKCAKPIFIFQMIYHCHKKMQYISKQLRNKCHLSFVKFSVTIFPSDHSFVLIYSCSPHFFKFSETLKLCQSIESSLFNNNSSKKVECKPNWHGLSKTFRE